MKFVPSKNQQAFYDWVEQQSGNSILNAVAGSGKTTTILNGIEKMRGTVWFGVYNKKMADEIKGKILSNKTLSRRIETYDKATRQFKRVNEPVSTSTFHSLGFSIISSWAGRGNRATVDDKKVSKIIEAVVAEREATAQEKLEDLRKLMKPVAQIVSLAKNRGFISPAGAAHHGLTDTTDLDAWFDMLDHFDAAEGVSEAELERAVSFARFVLGRSNSNTNVIDMDDMVYLPLALGLEPKPWHKFDWVLIDEAQDTNPTRRALAKTVLKPTGRLVAVGDPHQAIYGFTGADNDALEQIRDDMNAIELPLTVSYRCPKNVVAHAQQWVDHIEAHEGAPDGSVTEMWYKDLEERIVGLDPASYGETAIVCRNNKPLVGLCFKLIRAGIPAKIEGRSIGENLGKLATRWKSCKTVNGLETKLEEYEKREVDKAMKDKKEGKADRIVDEVATLQVMIERAREKGLDRVTDLTDMIDELFEDGVATSGQLTLCSAHKSKGLEWDDVYLLGREEFMPSKFAKQDWQLEQEDNLIYVAVTRTKKNLIEVCGVVPDKDPTDK